MDEKYFDAKYHDSQKVVCAFQGTVIPGGVWLKDRKDEESFKLFLPEEYIGYITNGGEPWSKSMLKSYKSGKSIPTQSVPWENYAEKVLVVFVL